ncbi:glutamine--fructose-6-phosphate transaminase (isomerizing) [Acidithiobacillus sp. CV18-2]|uniref:Glutamine--fructose-6-phosphate aminotransferase [isomerizing] n=1 Tax=Igneacidithiobacillus copahuensis TaxID=2724909 RepID=A0AAE2YN42_9PROT|nr:glutamine--fructose-6-phosphate transaminase (isomerizing) [Igneacidithiobacillus copahuensis]MBU2754533.1 glutamine--fructose-6-phosphate transaminase (isomerizing) [Acidithiobacillus sp. CV18-3]MBU2757305.1 glutamine--fructose-6-phosphate transaminase (isomerizing) [Acidithiobacillus sp. BN09-2]MBU2776874.1 glutamine--fructose-6-phosphate transaminase (isomerizing) [Acidithiobacillus sp. CV18-2]MBU2796301.1 glutamine--fructose-6-phosphate transaminase (isomerizing) [Acidithiobacillus sp. V
MCGIVGGIAADDVVPVILEGLRRLEYRGYDSAGLAFVDAQGELQRRRSVGRVAELAALQTKEEFRATIGIGHTRWATHGGIAEHNAHPLISHDEIAVVHNGIIENYQNLRSRLQSLGYRFTSETDTEVIAHLVHWYRQQLPTLLAAVQAASRELQGAYAFAVLSRRDPQELILHRKGCPLLLGIAAQGHFFASDVAALLPVTRRVIYLEDGDFARLQQNASSLQDVEGVLVQREEHWSQLSSAAIDLGPYRHFMQKEIYEQPRAVADTLEAALDGDFSIDQLWGKGAAERLQEIDRVLLLASGTSHYASLVGRQWIESIAGIPAAAELGHEYRYRESIPDPRQLIVTLSQSGETLDTYEALRHAQTLGHLHTLSICNVAESAIPRASALRFLTRAGPEIGVASTKAFTTQLVALYLLALSLGVLRGRVDATALHTHREALRQLPGSLQQALNLEPQIQLWANRFADKEHALFLGRGLHYPIALEGALKLKEISYIHAEAYPAGELKHGPLALVDRQMPVVVIAANDQLFEKVAANMQEVHARGGQLYVFTDLDSHYEGGEGVHVIRLPRHAGLLSPVLHAIPVQLLAYHAALVKGTDVDRPRNLAKAVTVE